MSLRRRDRKPLILFYALSRDDEKSGKLAEDLQDLFYESPIDHVYHRLDGTQLDLFQGYNQALELAGEYEDHAYLAFLHDDVELLGRPQLFLPVLELLDKPFTGLVGVAGATVVPESGCWWQQDHQVLRGMVAHPCEKNPFGLGFNTWPWQQAQFGPVAIVDGCFFLTKRQTLVRLGGFDQKSYQGFHFYDLDTSFRATLAGLVNYTAPLLVKHNSLGVPNDNWETNRRIFVERYRDKLPYQLKNRVLR